MTVSYQYEVASSTSGGFTRLLLMWRGSLYKLIYRELLLFLTSFMLLSLLYRNAFTADQRRLFERIVVYCDTFISLIPLSFVLGFYVAYVAGRWWQQYMAIPWPDKSMHCIALYVNGNDVHGRMVRRTLMRYLNLTLILVLRSISSAVKRRFPTLDHVVESGFMTNVELGMYQSVPSAEFNTYWIPCTWFISLLKESRKNSRITDPQGLKIIMEEFNEFRSKCGLLWSYDWVSIPLVYTQVVTIATYSFFLAALIGRQYVDALKKPFQMEIDKFIPVFTILQFFFFMGLLKVAEQLINPFGDDDEDFELNWLIDRHTKVSYLGVDTLMMRSPPLVKDLYFDESDITLPYTEAAVAYKKKTYRGSVHNMEVPEEKHTMFLPEIVEEDEKSLTPQNSFANLQQLEESSAPAAGTWRSQQPSDVPPVAEGDGSQMEKDLPISDEDQASLARYGSILSQKSSPVSNIKPSPSSSTLQPTMSEFTVQGSDTDTSINVEKQSSGFLFHHRKDLCKASEASVLDGLKVNVGSGIIGFSHQTKLLQQKQLDSSIQSLGKSRESLVQAPREIKTKYLSTSRESLEQNLKKKARNIAGWPKIVTATIHHKPPSSPGKKKGVRWKTVLDDNLDKRKTVDVVQALSQILDADENYLDQHGRYNSGREDKIPVYCDNCKRRLSLSPSERLELDLASGKLSKNLKQLLIYRPITYKFKTRSCPDLYRNQSDLVTDCDKDYIKQTQGMYDQLTPFHRRLKSDILMHRLENSRSLPAIKFTSSLINHINSPGIMGISSNLVPNVISTDTDLIPTKVLTSSLKGSIPNLAPDTSLTATDIDDTSWEPADWSTLLTSRTPSLDFSTGIAFRQRDHIGLNNAEDCNETLQEVVVQLDRYKPDSNR